MSSMTGRGRNDTRNRILRRLSTFTGDNKLGKGSISLGTGEFIPEIKRRFQFDDTALRRGASLKDIFAAEEPPEEDFNDIVDQDDERVEVFVSQELVGSLIDSVYFRIFIFTLIIVNSILIALQTDEDLSVRYGYIFSVFDYTVLAIFTFELLLKWYNSFWMFWYVGWNILDFVIIVALILGPSLTFLSSSRILRILRVLRAFRSLRSISALAGLSLVVQTILQSIPDMANIVLLLTIILVVFGVSGVTLFGSEVPALFGDLTTAMFSLFICVTQDGWVDLFKEFKEKGDVLYYAGAFYFLVCVVVGAFVFANLVVAVVVTNLELAMKELKEETKAEMDTLATALTDSKNSDDKINDKVGVVSVAKAHKHADVTAQTPLELADLKGLSTSRFEKYMLVLIALEENMAEYQSIKADLAEMLEVIRNINTMDAMVNNEMDDFGDDPGAGMRSIPTPHASGINLHEMLKGDIMSNMIKLEKMNVIGSKKANTMKDVIKSVLETEERPVPKSVHRPSASNGRLETPPADSDDKTDENAK